MADPYQELLDAAIEHLTELKARGVRFVPVREETFAMLSAGSGPAPARSHAAATNPTASSPRGSAAPFPPAGRMESPKPSAPLGGEPKAAQTQAAIPQKANTPLSPKPDAPPASLGNAPAAVPQQGPDRASHKTKAEAMEALRARVLHCSQCGPLAAARKSVVFGVGNPEAELMFVGEAPGAEEDLRGEPFVGNAGQLLTRIIAAMGLAREKVYIANILKCRPDTPGQTSGNRPPTADEMSTCAHYLHEQIDIIQPKVLVGLGGVALSGLVGKTGISRLRGNWLTYRSIPLMPTYHPSYLLHQQNVGDKRLVWEDMMKVMEKLGLPISEKQRNYFLK